MKTLEIYNSKNEAVNVVINHASATKKGTGYYVLSIEVEIEGVNKTFTTGTNDMTFIDDLESKFDIEAIYNFKEDFFKEMIEEYIYHNLED